VDDPVDAGRPQPFAERRALRPAERAQVEAVQVPVENGVRVLYIRVADQI